MGKENLSSLPCFLLWVYLPGPEPLVGAAASEDPLFPSRAARGFNDSPRRAPPCDSVLSQLVMEFHRFPSRGVQDLAWSGGFPGSGSPTAQVLAVFGLGKDVEWFLGFP